MNPAMLQACQRHKLSRRESEVAGLLADGASLKVIASELKISVRAVCFYGRRIRVKMRAPSTTAAVFRLAR